MRGSRMPVKMITLWYKYTDKGNKVAVFNHIENGHVDGESPKPKDKSYTNQKAWEKSEWKKQFAYIDQQYQVWNTPPAFWTE